MNSSTEDPAQGEGKGNDGDSSVYGYLLARSGRGVGRSVCVGRQQGIRGAGGGGRAGPSVSLLLRPARRVRLSAAISRRRATFWDLEEPS